MADDLRNNQAKLRVLLAGHLPPPVGGIGTYCLALLESSLPARVNLRFAQTSSQRRSFSSSGRLSLANVTATGQDLLRFAAALIGHRPHVTHISTTFGWSFLKHSLCVLLARAAGSRVLLQAHCSFPVLYADRPAWWQWYVRRILHLTDGLLVLSQEWLAISAVLPNTPIYYLPNAVDLTRYQSLAHEHLSREQHNSHLNVLYLGYLGKAKGSIDLIDTAALLAADADCPSFNLVGDELASGERQSLCRMVTAKGLQDIVTIRTPVYGQDKLACFRAADVFVMPSHHEGMPMAVLEAMACALPVVATSVGGLPDLVEDGSNGFLVEPENPGGMAAALRTLVRDSEKRTQMRQASYALVTAHYDLAQLVDHLVKIYAETAAGTPRRASSPLPRIRARMDEAVAAPWKMRNEVQCWACHLLMRSLFALSGICWPAGARFYGAPVLQKHRGSHMQFGPKLCLRSSVRSNPLGPSHPVILVTWQPGARLEIGRDFAMTGGTICAAEHVSIGNRVTIGANTTIVDTDFHPIESERTATISGRRRNCPRGHRG